MLLCYEALFAAIQNALPTGVPSQLANLALLVSAFLFKRYCQVNDSGEKFSPFSPRFCPITVVVLQFRRGKSSSFPTLPPLVAPFWVNLTVAMPPGRHPPGGK